MAVLVLLIVLLFVSRWATKRAFRSWLGRGDRVQAGDVCRCGYDLSNLALPRCPECGRVRHFDSTSESLGLTDDELRRIAEAKQRRDALAADVKSIGARR